MDNNSSIMIHRANSGTKSNLLDQFNTVLLLIVTHSNTAHTSNRNTSVSKRTSTHHCPASHFPLGSSCWAPNDCPFSASNVHYKSCPFFFTAIIPDSNASLPPPCTLQTCRELAMRAHSWPGAPPRDPTCRGRAHIPGLCYWPPAPFFRAWPRSTWEER